MAQQDNKNMGNTQKSGSQSKEPSNGNGQSGQRAEDSKLNIQDATKQNQVHSDQDLGDIE